jgi:hypothetical protein
MAISLTYSSVTDSQVKLTLSGLDDTHAYERDVYWAVLYSGGQQDAWTTLPAYSSGGYKYITGLPANTECQGYAEIWNADRTTMFWNGTTSTFYTEMEQLDAPAYVSHSNDHDSVYVDCTSVSGADTYHFLIKVYGEASYEQTINRGSSNVTFDNLSSDTHYAVYCYVSGTGYEDSLVVMLVDFYTDPAPVEPWAWWSTVASGYPFSISPAEWQAFLDRINAIRVHNGLSNYTFGNFNGDNPTSGDNFKALYYNEAVLAINGLGYSYAQVSSGDDVIAERFNSLKNAINAKI